MESGDSFNARSRIALRFIRATACRVGKAHACRAPACSCKQEGVESEYFKIGISMGIEGAKLIDV